jgi:hypothetical protein
MMLIKSIIFSMPDYPLIHSSRCGGRSDFPSCECGILIGAKDLLVCFVEQSVLVVLDSCHVILRIDHVKVLKVFYVFVKLHDS